MSISTHEADWDETEGLDGEVEVSSTSHRAGQVNHTVRAGQGCNAVPVLLEEGR